MIKGFDQYIVESFGKVTVKDRAGAHMNEPDNIVPHPSLINTRAGGAGPGQWAGSEQMTHGQYRSGANPKKDKKKMGNKSNVYSFDKFEKNRIKTQKLEEDQLMMGQNPSASPEMQALMQKGANITQQVNALNIQLETIEKEKLALMKSEGEAAASNAADVQQTEAPAPQMNTPV
jgi:hypothetical protein